MITRVIIKQIKEVSEQGQAEIFEMGLRLEDGAIPESFSQGLDDIQHGHVVDTETVLRAAVAS